METETGMPLFYLDSDSRLPEKSEKFRSSKNWEHTEGRLSTESDDCTFEK